MTESRESADPLARPDLISAPIRTDADVLTRVGRLLAAPDRQRRSLWLFFLEPDGRQLPVVVPIEPLPAGPDSATVDSLCQVVAQVLEESVPGGSAVLTLTRPGAPAATLDDHRWCDAIRDAAGRHDAAIRMLCLATPAGVRELIST